MQLTLPGTYLFKVSGSHNQPIFNSVFEYDQFREILAHLDNTSLIAYVFSEHEMQWVMRCDESWGSMIEELKNQLQQQHKRIWNQTKPVLSNQVEATYIDEHQFLVPLVMKLHYWPVLKGIVVSPELYPFSSDHFYRQSSLPSWLKADPVLTRLVHQRFNRSLRYERICELYDYQQPVETHRLYNAYASDQHIRLLLNQQADNHEKVTWEEALLLMKQAQQLVAQRLGIDESIFETGQHNRQHTRLLQQVHALTAWLLDKKNVSLEYISYLVKQDEQVVQSWLLGVSAQHPETFMNRLLASWNPLFQAGLTKHTAELNSEAS